MNPIYPYYGERTVCKEQPIAFPPQHQDRQPGLESLMNPRPISENPEIIGSGKLKGKVALITGGDSGIGKAAAIAFAKEGADIAIAYLYEASDAEVTQKRIEELGQRCLRIEVDLRHKENCFRAVEHTIRTFGKLDILVNNHGVQYPQKVFWISQKGNCTRRSRRISFHSFTSLRLHFHILKKCIHH